MFVGGGGVKLYHSVWEPPIMCLAWKIVRSLGSYVDNESIPLKIIFSFVLKALSSGTSANPCFPLRRGCHLLLLFLLSQFLITYSLVGKHHVVGKI